MEKPKCKLVGINGNVFVIIGKVCDTLNKAGMKDVAKEFSSKAFDCESYDAVLCLCHEYVDIH